MRLFSGFPRDLIQAARALAKARAFTLVCVVTLGIGMAPLIAIPYASRLFRMMPPGVQTEGLVEIIMRSPGDLEDDWSYPGYLDLRNADTGMEIIGWSNSQTELSRPDGFGRESVPAIFVSANYFKALGLTSARGPGFDAVADNPGADPVVVVGYRFWQNRLGSDPDILGKPLTLDGIAHVVVGIAPDRFSGHLAAAAGAQLFVPLERHPRLRTDGGLRSNRDIGWVNVHGRLSPGISLAQGNAAIAAVTARLGKQYPASNEARVGFAEPYDPAGYAGRSGLMWQQALLTALTGMVLLVVCLNVSGMMQVRSALRERELSVRQAIGASRARLVQYLLAEALILAGLGAALDAIVLFNVPPILSWWFGAPIPADFLEALTPDLYIVATCAGVCLATTLVFGLLPALRFSRPAIVSSLKDDAGGGGRRVGRLQRVAVALQIGLAVPFLVLSGMLVERIRSTATADLGFETAGLAGMRLNLDDAKEKQNPGFFIRSARENLERAAGITSVTVADALPLDFTVRFQRVSRQDDASFIRAQVTRVGERYLETLGIPLLRGRGITDEDRAGTEPVTVISKSLADRLFPNGGTADAIGKRLVFAVEGRQDKASAEVFRIVGVTADFATWEISEDPEQLLLPLAQHPATSVLLVARGEAGGRPIPPTAALETAVRDLAPDLKTAAIVTGDQIRERSIRKSLELLALEGVPGGIVLALAALGIYGVVGLMVASRTREMAVRMALGASHARVLGTILSGVVKLVLPGVAGGLVIAAVLVRLGILGPALSGFEHLAYLAGAATAILVAVVASLSPARRAASVAPIVAMRSE